VGCGAVSGAILAWAMDFRTPRGLLQGAVGGLIAGLLMVLLLPR
jgi:uncharacterized membrane protein